MREENDLINDIRKLWNEFDPIGVYSFSSTKETWPEDEYDSYVVRTLDLLEQDADEETLIKYITYICEQHMCIKVPASKIEGFASKLILWKTGKIV